MFSNSFYEMAIRSKATAGFYWKMLMCTVITSMGVLAFPLLGGVSFMFFILGIWLFVMFAPERKIEYEYTFTDGSVEIAAVLDGSKRKELLSFDMESVTMVVPKDSQRISNEKFAKIRNYSSKKKDAKIICLVAELNKSKQLIMLEPDEQALGHIKTYARNKMYDID